MRTFKLCGHCGHPSVEVCELQPFSNCGLWVGCKACKSISIDVSLNPHKCETCKGRIYCLSVPTVQYISEMEYFFPIAEL